MRILLPGGVEVDWTPNQVAEAINTLVDAQAGSLALAIAELSNESSSLRFDGSHTPPPHDVASEVEMLDGERFRFRGRTYPLSPDQWVVLDVIVNGDGEFSTLAERLWGDPTVESQKIHKPIASLRGKLRKLGVSLSPAARHERAFLQETGFEFLHMPAAIAAG